MKKFLLFLLIFGWTKAHAQKFQSIGYSLQNGEYLTRGLQTGIKELEFRNQKNKVQYLIKWKRVVIDTDVYYNGKPIHYYNIAIGDKASDTIRLKFFNRYKKRDKRMAIICRKNLSVFVILSGMFVYELKETHNKNSR